MGFISKDALKQVLFQHVVEIKFLRKHPNKTSSYRRMFCVGAFPNFQNNAFLLAEDTMARFNFTLPKGSSPYPPVPYFNPDHKNLVITWDIFMQNYRCINVRNCNLVSSFRVESKEDIANFWKYFDDKITGMGTQDIMDFHRK
jgi:hypothetical protein